MILPHPSDAIHKAMLYRLLTGLLDAQDVAPGLLFKGGTSAAMLGWLDRFSLDLDFDLAKIADKTGLRKSLLLVFDRNGFFVAQQAKNELYFLLKYPAPAGRRNTLKLSIIDTPVKANVYQPQFLSDIGRYAICQTIETMFANKLVAVTDRFKKYHAIAGRDIYDIHHFFLQGYSYNPKIIQERTGLTPVVYLTKLTDFIRQKVTETTLTEDLSYLLPPTRFAAIRKVLKQEVIMFLADARRRGTL